MDIRALFVKMYRSGFRFKKGCSRNTAFWIVQRCLENIGMQVPAVAGDTKLSAVQAASCWRWGSRRDAPAILPLSHGGGRHKRRQTYPRAHSAGKTGHNGSKTSSIVSRCGQNQTIRKLSRTRRDQLSLPFRSLLAQGEVKIAFARNMCYGLLIKGGYIILIWGESLKPS